MHTCMRAAVVRCRRGRQTAIARQAPQPRLQHSWRFDQPMQAELPSPPAHVVDHLGLLLVRQVAPGAEAPASEQHLEEGVRIAGEVQLSGLQHLRPCIEGLLYGRARLSRILEDLNYSIRKGGWIRWNDNVPLACSYIHTTVSEERGSGISMQAHARGRGRQRTARRLGDRPLTQVLAALPLYCESKKIRVSAGACTRALAELQGPHLMHNFEFVVCLRLRAVVGGC